MEVFKFGGASVKDASGIQNVVKILNRFSETRKMVIISALGKTTNALEDVTNLYLADDPKYLQFLREIREYHITVAHELFEEVQQVELQLFALFDTVELFCTTNTKKDYNFVYDQIVSIGELASTKLISTYLNKKGVKNKWLDARKLIVTNSAFTDAKIDWDRTELAVQSSLEDKHEIYLTQGFIGGTTDGNTTTLGREGSDFSAAILAYCSDANKMTIWKDVPGILSGDPKIVKDAILIPRISYREAIEMTYYGAKVIHPKTIRPLQNKKIALYVNSFLAPEKVGTVIHHYEEEIQYPPIIVKMPKQILMSFSSRDFSFIAEDSLAIIFKAFDECRLRINMMHSGAISFSVSVDNTKPGKIVAVKEKLERDFGIKENKDLTLLTIRHYNDAIVARETANCEILLEQRTRNNVQYLIQ